MFLFIILSIIYHQATSLSPQTTLTTIKNKKKTLVFEVFPPSAPQTTTLMSKKTSSSPITQPQTIELESKDLNPTELIQASGLGNTYKVKSLLKNVNANITDKTGKTPLHWAAQNGHTEIVQLLLQHNADPHITDREGETPLYKAYLGEHVLIIEALLQHIKSLRECAQPLLHWAVQNGHIHIIELLTNKHEVSPNRVDSQGLTALHKACENGHSVTAEILIQNGANPNITDKNNESALHKACANGHTDTVELLTFYGADPHIKNKQKKTPFKVAGFNGHFQTAHYLFKKINRLNSPVNMTDENKQRTLLEVCSDGNLTAVKYLLSYKIDLNFQDSDGNSALYLACLNNHIKIATILLNLGANPNITNKKGDNPLYDACQNGYSKIAIRLLEYGANPNIKDKYRRTPLHLAAQHGHINIINSLIEHNADLNAIDVFGQTPLSDASHNGHDLVFDTLRKKGANPNSIDRKGYQTLRQARSDGHKKILQTLTKTIKKSVKKPLPNILLPGLNEQKEWDENVDLTDLTDKGTGELFSDDSQTKDLLIQHINHLVDQFSTQAFQPKEKVWINQIRTQLLSKISNTELTVHVDIKGLNRTQNGSIEVGLVQNDFNDENNRIDIEFFLSPQAKEILKDDTRRPCMKKIYEIELMSVANQLFLKELTQIKTTDTEQQIWQQRIESAIKAFKNKKRLPLGDPHQTNQAINDALLLLEILPLQAFAQLQSNGLEENLLDQFLQKDIYTLYGVKSQADLKANLKKNPEGIVEITGWRLDKTDQFLKQFQTLIKDSDVILKKFFEGIYQVEDSSVSQEVKTLLKTNHVLFSA